MGFVKFAVVTVVVMASACSSPLQSCIVDANCPSSQWCDATSSVCVSYARPGSGDGGTDAGTGGGGGTGGGAATGGGTSAGGGGGAGGGAATGGGTSAGGGGGTGGGTATGGGTSTGGGPAVAITGPLSTTSSPLRSRTPTLTGTADVGATVTIFNGAGCTGSSSSPSTTNAGAWMVSLTTAMQAASDGPTSYFAQATLGEKSTCSAGFVYYTDNTGPALTITQKPPPMATSTASLSFTASDVSSPISLQCQLDAQPPVACTAGASYSSLAPGNHTFTLSATDGLGNTSSTAYTWSVSANPTCGNGVREGLEGCDDGNVASFDGCSASCVYELDGRPAFNKTSLSYNGLWMTVTPSGEIYMDVGGSGGSIDTITKVDTDGTISANFVPGVHSQYGGDVVAVGEDLVFGGSNASDWSTWIQRWSPSNNTTTKLFSIAGAYFYNFASNAAADRLFYADYGSGSLYKVTSATTSAVYSSQTLTKLLYDQQRGRLYAVSNGTLFVDASGGSGSTGTFSSLFTYAGIGDLTIDAEGTLYLTCSTGSFPSQAPCATGSVVAVSPTGSPYRPFIASNAIVRRIGYDAARNQLVVVSGNNIFRVSLAR